MKYTKIINELGNEIITLVLEDTILSIPADIANSDYQQYLQWLENPIGVEHLTEIPTP